MTEVFIWLSLSLSLFVWTDCVLGCTSGNNSGRMGVTSKWPHDRCRKMIMSVCVPCVEWFHFTRLLSSISGCAFCCAPYLSRSLFALVEIDMVDGGQVKTRIETLNVSTHTGEPGSQSVTDRYIRRCLWWPIITSKRHLTLVRAGGSIFPFR